MSSLSSSDVHGSGSTATASPPPPPVQHDAVHPPESTQATARPAFPADVADEAARPPTTQSTDVDYQMNTNAYDSIYETVREEAQQQQQQQQQDMMNASGSGTMDAMKDVYNPIGMRFVGSGPSPLMPSFESATRLNSAGDGGFLRSAASMMHSSSLPPEHRSNLQSALTTPPNANDALERGDPLEETAVGRKEEGVNSNTALPPLSETVTPVDARTVEEAQGTGTAAATPAVSSENQSPPDTAAPAPEVTQIPSLPEQEHISAYATPLELVGSSSSSTASASAPAQTNVPAQKPPPASPPLPATPPTGTSGVSEGTATGEGNGAPSPSASSIPSTSQSEESSPESSSSTDTASSSYYYSSSSSDTEGEEEEGEEEETEDEKKRKSSSSTHRKSSVTTTRSTSGRLGMFVPLLQQHGYRKGDIKDIACSADYTALGVANAATVSLEAIRPAFLPRYEPVTAVRDAMVSRGRPRSAKQERKRAAKASRRQRRDAHGNGTSCRAPKSVTVMDFPVSPVAYENIVLAIALALYGSVLYHDDLVRAARRHFERLSRRQRRRAEASSTATTSSDPATRTTSSSGSGGEPGPDARIHVALPLFLRWLNRQGVDVLVMTTDRRACSSFCAKRRHVQRDEEVLSSPPEEQVEGHCPSSDGGATAPLPPAAQDATPQTPHNRPVKQRPFVDRAPLHRVLVALEYDRAKKLWGPVTTVRPIRVVASAQHQKRKTQRRASRRARRRETRLQARRAAAKAEEDRIAAKWAEWKEKQRRWAEERRGSDSAGGLSDSLGDAGILLPGAATQMAADGGSFLVDDVPAAGSKNGLTDAAAAEAAMPFYNMKYPNLVQTDFGIGLVLGQSTHRKLGRIRLKLLLGVPLAFIATAVGLALLIYISITFRWCPYDIALDSCIDPDSLTATATSSDSDSSGSISCPSAMYGTEFESSLANRFLYGAPMAIGNSLIVAIAMMFAAVFVTVLFVFFVTRFLATGSTRPLFFYVLHAVHVLLCLVACAFSAYPVSVAAKGTHVFPCSFLKPHDAELCRTRLKTCGGTYDFRVFQTGAPHTALALAIVFLALNVLSLAVAVVPALPQQQLRDRLPRAQPQTYAFKPSPYAPDGMSPPQRAALQAELRPALRRQLRRQVQRSDILLTRNVSVGEMMQANREQSLRRMELATKANERRRRRGQRGFRVTTGRRDRKALRYVCFTDEVGRADDASPADPLDELMLSPSLVAEVRTISRRVRRRRGEEDGDGIGIDAPFVSESGSSRSSSTSPPRSLPASDRPVAMQVLGAPTRAGIDFLEAATAHPSVHSATEAPSLNLRSTAAGGPESLLERSGDVSAGRSSRGDLSEQIQAVGRNRSSRSLRRQQSRNALGGPVGPNPFAPHARERVERQREKVLKEKEPTIQAILARLQSTSSEKKDDDSQSTAKS